MVTITTVNARGSAKRVGMPWLSSHASPRSAMVAPLKAPATMPTRVMPIWTVDSSRPGSPVRSSATRAPREPSRTICSSSGRLADTSASSDIARKPLSTISPTTMASSTASMVTPREFR